MAEKLEQYYNMFGDGFPMIPLGWGRSETEIIEIIDKCLKEKKDVYELGFVKDGEIY